MKNPPNINAENLPLPPGYRWVDIANEDPRTDAKIWIPRTRAWIPCATGTPWTANWSYCVPVDTAAPATPEPDPDFIWHALTLPDPDTCAMLLDAADLYDATRMSGDLDNVDWPFPPDLCAWASLNRDALEAGAGTEAGQ